MLKNSFIGSNHNNLFKSPVDCPTKGAFTVITLDLWLLSMIAAIIFHFLPITCQMDIRTAKFLLKFIANDNSICKLFSTQAEINLKKVFKL